MSLIAEIGYMVLDGLIVLMLVSLVIFLIGGIAAAIRDQFFPRRQDADPPEPSTVIMEPTESV